MNRKSNEGNKLCWTEKKVNGKEGTLRVADGVQREMVKSYSLQFRKARQAKCVISIAFVATVVQ